MKRFLWAVVAIFLVTSNTAFAQTNLGDKLKGKVLLQVEDGGRIWYVAAKDKKRHEVTFKTALPVFQQHAIGVTNENLEKIPIALDSVSKDVDSDGDGYSNFDEVQTGYNPFSLSQKPFYYDFELADRLKGMLLLQVEDAGRIWYVDFSGNRWEITWANLMDRFQKLALGITNANLERIAVGKTQIKAPTNKTMETHVVNLNINIDNVKVSGEVSETTTCKEKHCFEKEFKACNAGQINRLNYLELPVEREYTIVGPSGDNCVITVDYIKDLNPKYEGLKARCTYNTSLSFHNAMQHADNKTMSAYSEALSKNQNLKNVQTDCSGSYWDIMMNIK